MDRLRRRARVPLGYLVVGSTAHLLLATEVSVADSGRPVRATDSPPPPERAKADAR